jgi:FMN phosphatase YigB (HAD superfamily)
VSLPESLPPIRAVLFDVDGTLYHARWMRLRMAASLLLLPLRGPRRALAVIRHLRSYRRALEEVRDWPPSDENVAVAHLMRAAQLAGDEPDRVRATVEDWFMKRPLPYLRRCRRAGLLELLEQLRRAGCQIGFFSDYPVEDKLDALGVREFASVCLSAGDPEVNAFKPRPQGFQRACEVWGLAPAEVLYVGDRPEVDAAGAVAAGMRCVIIGSRGRADSPEAFQPADDFAELRAWTSERV